MNRVLCSIEDIDMAPSIRCARCAQPVEEGWQNCPQCGEVLEGSDLALPEEGGETAGIGGTPDRGGAPVELEGLRVLVVEDDPDIQEVVSHCLLEHRFAVEVASDGVDALECISRQKPHLVVTDVTMPRMDGLKLVERLRQDALVHNSRSRSTIVLYSQIRGSP